MPTCLILAGGFGTRLRPVLQGTPKCLAPILGRPFLAHQLEALARGGIGKAVLCTGYLADQVLQGFGNCFAGIDLSYSQEDEPLGTGGAARLAAERVEAEDYLVVNGDSFVAVDYSAMTGSYRAAGRLPLMALVEVADAARYGRVELQPQTANNSRVEAVRKFVEKGERAAGWINAGVYLLTREELLGLPAGVTCSLERDLFPRLVEAGRLTAFRAGSLFIDIGTPASYAVAEAFFQNMAVPLGE